MNARRALRWSAWALAGLALAWGAGSLLVAWRLSRRWSARCDEPMPAAMAARAESVRLTTRDGEELGAWFLPAAGAGAPSVAMFHGWRCTRSTRLGAASVFERAGCAVLLVTHRCHGDSSGECEDFGWSAQLDVVAAVEWLERRRPGSPVVVCGASLGAVAATLAARELGTRVDGYVLECPFASLDSAARRRTDAFLPWGVDWAAYAGVQLGAACFAPRWNETAPIEAAAEIPAGIPVLFFAGERDSRAPPNEVAEIAARVRGPHELVVVAGVDHDRLLAGGGDAYGAAVRGWLAKHFESAR